MKQILKSQRGVVPLVEVLVLALVLAAGAAVYVRVQNSNKSAKVEDSGGVKKKASSQKPASTQGYLVISEWGVRVRLSESVLDLYYKNDSKLGTGFRTKKLDHLAPNCSSNTLWVQRGKPSSIYNAEVGTSTFANQYTQMGQSPSFHKQLGQYYYIESAPGATCLADNSDIKLVAEIRTALDTIEEVK